MNHIFDHDLTYVKDGKQLSMVPLQRPEKQDMELERRCARKENVGNSGGDVNMFLGNCYFGNREKTCRGPDY